MIEFVGDDELSDPDLAGELPPGPVPRELLPRRPDRPLTLRTLRRMPFSVAPYALGFRALQSGNPARRWFSAQPQIPFRIHGLLLWGATKVRALGSRLRLSRMAQRAAAAPRRRRGREGRRMLSWLSKAWKFLRWAVGAERALEPVVKELADAVTDEPSGPPLPFLDVERQRAQADAATSHKVPPPSSPAPTPKPHPRNP